MDPEPPSSFLPIINFDSATDVPLLLAISVLLLLSAIVSGSEVSYFSLSNVQLDDLRTKKSKREKTIVALLEKPRQLLATILIANNFINVGIVILSTFLINQLFDFGLNTITAFVVEVIIVTTTILLFGEILPKIYATSNPMRLAVLTAIPLNAMRKFFYPLIIVLTRTSRFFEKPSKSSAFSVDDLTHALELTDTNNPNVEEQKMLAGIVRFGNTGVRQVMTPRINIVALDIDDTFVEVTHKIVETGFSRLPVFEESLDHIKGVIYIKDLLPYLEASPDFAWRQLMREPFYVPESKKIDDLLIEFQSKKTHLAIVVDEFGGTSGIISLEDVIEEIVGEISDEFDNEDLIYSKLDPNTFLFEGRTPLNDFYKVLNVDGQAFEDAKGDADTLAGMLLEIWGKFPEKNEILTHNGFVFKIENIENRRLQRIKVSLPPDLTS